MSGISQTTSYMGSEFVRQCGEASGRLADLLFSYPKPVAILVLPATMAAAAKVLGVSRDDMVAMLDSALADMDEADKAP